MWMIGLGQVGRVGDRGDQRAATESVQGERHVAALVHRLDRSPDREVAVAHGQLNPGAVVDVPIRLAEDAVVRPDRGGHHDPAVIARDRVGASHRHRAHRHVGRHDGARRRHVQPGGRVVDRCGAHRQAGGRHQHGGSERCGSGQQPCDTCATSGHERRLPRVLWLPPIESARFGACQYRSSPTRAHSPWPSAVVVKGLSGVAGDVRALRQPAQWRHAVAGSTPSD
jgi:hypothetical protein